MGPEVIGLVLGVPYNSTEIVTTVESLRGCPRHPPTGAPTAFCPVCGRPSAKVYRDTPKEKLATYLGKQVPDLAQEDIANFMDNLRDPGGAVGAMGLFQRQPENQLIFGIMLCRTYKPLPLADLPNYTAKIQSYADSLGITWKDPTFYQVEV